MRKYIWLGLNVMWGMWNNPSRVFARRCLLLVHLMGFRYSGLLAYGRDLLAREHCGDAVENGVVYVEDVGFFDELRGVPMVVSGEHGGLGLGIHTKDEGLGSFITGNNGKK